MSVNKYITHGSGMKCGSMTCSKCNKSIGDEYYLVADYFVSKRGNEDDYIKIYHKACSLEDKTWATWREQLEQSKKKQVEELSNLKKQAIEKINNATWIWFSTEENDDETITIQM